MFLCKLRRFRSCWCHSLLTYLCNLAVIWMTMLSAIYSFSSQPLIANDWQPICSCNFNCNGNVALKKCEFWSCKPSNFFFRLLKARVVWRFSVVRKSPKMMMTLTPGWFMAETFKNRKKFPTRELCTVCPMMKWPVIYRFALTISLINFEPGTQNLS